MSIFDNVRKKALKKLEEEDEEKSGEDEALEEEDGVIKKNDAVDDTSSTTDEGVGGPPSSTGEGEWEAEGESAAADDDSAAVDDVVDGADISVDDSVDDVVDGEVPAEGEVIEEEPPQSPEGDSSPEGGAADRAEDVVSIEDASVEDATSDIDEGAQEDLSGDAAGVSPRPTEEVNVPAEGESVPDEGPLNEREQRLASEINRLQDVADQATAQLSELQAQLDEANKLLEQTSATAEEAIEGAAVSSGPPIFDHAAYRMMDAAAAEEYAAEHDRRMSEYYGRQAEERYRPYIDEHDKAMRTEGRRSAIGRLFETGELPGIEESETDIFKILDEIPALQNDDSESAVAAAYLISVGLNAIKSTGEAREKTAAEIVAEIEANPEVMKLLAEKQAAALEENGKIPAFTRRASARSVPSEAPLTLNAASERARKRFK